MGGFDVAGARVVIAGAAASGMAAAELLVARGAHVVVSDTKRSVAGADRLGAIGVGFELGGHVEATFTTAGLVVVSPGVPWRLPVLEAARAAGVEVIGEIELASRWLEGRVVAVTGTKGKSTTTTLVGRMLEAAGVEATVGGNIGVPLSSQVACTGPDVVHVVEASSFQLEGITRFRPAIAVLLNFSPDHLDRHATIEAYGEAKARVFENQRPDDVALVNADDPEVARLSAGATAERVGFSVGESPTARFRCEGEWIVDRHGGMTTRIAPRARVRLPGRHLLADVVAAAGVARLLGAPPEAIEEAIAGFSGLEHALERVGEIDGVSFVNDSKATNVESAVRAIEAFESGVVAIVGGQYKGGDLARMGPPLEARGGAVVAIGEAASLVRAALEATVPVHGAETLRAAVERAFALAPPGGVVLLAPACASFDMFRDYAERGRVFRAEVARLASARATREQ